MSRLPALLSRTHKRSPRFVSEFSAFFGAGVLGFSLSSHLVVTEAEAIDEEKELIWNWSGTHACQPVRIYEPESATEVEAIVKRHHETGEKLRVVGSALSPNGIGLTDDSMLNVAFCDRVLHVDKELMQVTVEPGIKVGDLCTALRPHGLTLQNLASIAEQQVGGFLQVGAHGTGAAIPPVDMTVVRLRIVTPGMGTLDLSRTENPILFDVARVALGALGVLTEVTLQCVPAHDLLEHTYTLTQYQLERDHAAILQEHRHARFMWIPYTDTVVVITNDPLSQGAEDLVAAHKNGGLGVEAATRAMRTLLCDTYNLPHMERIAPGAAAALESALKGMSFSQLRDALLVMNPLDVGHVKRVNAAEAEYWKQSEGYRIGSSVDLLQFDCGGQQWVSEVAFPAGALSTPSMADIEYMKELLSLIEKRQIPAPAPIEQRWTSGSDSVMSPASTHAGGGKPVMLDKDSLHSWVGIIMYLPSEDPELRAAITKAFDGYKDACASELWPKYGAVEHWAKIEIPAGEGASDRMKVMRTRLAERYPLDIFNNARRLLDPRGILTNPHLEKIIPLSEEPVAK